VAAAILVTAVAVVALARFQTHPPRTVNPRSALRPAEAVREATEAVAAAPAQRHRRRHRHREVTATGIAVQTPFTVIQVRATVRHRRIVAVKTVVMSGDGPHTRAINARAEPILRREALRAGTPKIDIVSGATGTSNAWTASLMTAVQKAGGRLH
jgi:uncharacterized protein with FMN-binding domain